MNLPALREFTAGAEPDITLIIRGVYRDYISVRSLRDGQCHLTPVLADLGLLHSTSTHSAREYQRKGNHRQWHSEHASKGGDIVGQRVIELVA